MPFENGRPIIGAAVNAKTLPAHIGWLREKPRDIEIQDFSEVGALDGDWQPRAAAIKAALDGHAGRLGIHGPFWGLRLDNPDALLREIVTRRFMQGLDVCAALGATQMVIHSPFTTWDANNLDLYPNARARQMDFVHQTLQTVVARAADMGVVLVVENIEDKDPRDRNVLVESFASPAIRVSIDTGHAHYAHGSTGAPPVDYFVRAAGALLHHIHLQDADGYADRHWAPGDGSINWIALFAALAVTGADPHLVLELRDHAEIPKGARHLMDLGLVV